MKNVFLILLSVSLLNSLIIPQALFAQNFIKDSSNKQKTIVLANETSWPPHYGKEFKNGGYTTEIITQAMLRMGYKVKIEWLPWNRAVTLATKGVYDGLGACYFTQERAKSFVYTETIGATQSVFFKLKEKNISYTSLEQLKAYKIGIARGYGYPQIFNDATYLNKIITSKVEFNINKLLNYRVDLVIGSKKVIQHLLNSKYPTEKQRIEIMQPAIESMPLYVAFSKKSKGYEQKVKDFNQGLKLIKEDGTFDKILRSYGF